MSDIEYKWENGTDVFILSIGQEYSAWNGEGILQHIYLRVNGFCIFSTIWGVDLLLGEINTQINNSTTIDINDLSSNSCFSKNSFYYKRHNFDDGITIIGNDYIEFHKWLLSCLLPKEEGRKIKLEKIFNKKYDL